MSILGIDIGGTTVKYALFDGKHNIINEVILPTPSDKFDQQLIQHIEEHFEISNLKGIGIATAGLVNIEKRLVESAANIPQIENIPICERLEEHFKVRVAINNDANCAALAEAKQGSAQDAPTSLCVTIGTGIGGGFIVNGQPLSGAHGYALEIGHMVVHKNGRACGCGRKGCWEAYASGSAIRRSIDEFPSLSGFTPENVFEDYNERKECRKIIDQFISDLVLGLVNIQYLYDPHKIIIGGGVIDSAQVWWKLLLEEINKVDLTIEVGLATFKNQAGVIGAAYLVK